MYKIMQNNKVIDVVHVPNFVSFLPTGHIAMTDKASAHGIIGSDEKTIYSFMPIAGKDYKVVSIEYITLSEFNRLKNLLNSDNATSVNNLVLRTTRANKILELSTLCKNKITEGFSVRLLDDNWYNFRLTAEDQLNLMLLENQLNSDSDIFVYHATNQPCKAFEREDIVKVIKAFRKYVTFHTTYFNVAKQYINSLTDIVKINEFNYGNDIPYEVDDEVVLAVIKNGDKL